MLPLLGLNANKKEFLKSTSNLHITLSLELKRQIRSCIPSKTIHTRIQTQMGKVHTCFQTLKTVQKTLPFGAAHTHKVNIREYPPGTYPAYGLIDTQKNVPSGRWDGYTTGSGGIICDLDCSFKILQLIQHARFAFVYCTVAEHWIIFF